MKILIVEDHPDCRNLLEFFVRKMGYETVGVENGDKAIACAAMLQPDLILMDLSLPDMNGIEVTAVLKRNLETSQIPVVIISALPASIWETNAAKAGAAHYLTKPASALEMRQTIEKFTGGNREIRS